MEFFLIHLKKSRFIENNGFFFFLLKKSRFIENNWFFCFRLKKSQFIDLLKKSQFIDNKLRLWLWRHHLSAGPEQKSQFIDLLKKVAKGAKIVKGAKGAIYAVPKLVPYPKSAPKTVPYIKFIREFPTYQSP